MRVPRFRMADERIDWKGSAPFIAVQFIPLLAIFTGVTTKALVFGAVAYVVRMFAITGGYHRYFAHRSYRLPRAPQAVLAFVGTMAAQKGPLWWAANHRDHHKYADTPRDPHSPQKGFWWAHIGWILSGKYSQPNYDDIPDFAKYPELRWMDKHDWVGPWTLGVLSFLVAGWSGLVVGFFGSTLLLWHMTFMVNSVAHVWGKRRYGTGDTSRNSVFVAALTMGEGWHNNHHHYPACARQGFFWWELDVTYLILRAGRVLGVVKDMREPPESAKTARRIRFGHIDLGRFKLHLRRAQSAVPESASNPAVEELLAMLAAMEDRAAQVSRESRVRAEVG